MHAEGKEEPRFPEKKKIILFWNRIMCISADNGLLTFCVEKMWTMENAGLLLFVS